MPSVFFIQSEENNTIMCEGGRGGECLGMLAFRGVLWSWFSYSVVSGDPAQVIKLIQQVRYLLSHPSFCLSQEKAILLYRRDRVWENV